jgi:glycosyltransferase involved in cell wall biosynthesis
MRNYKISFCTVSMNRLHHLEKTLSANLLDNQDYLNLEFILLDYNSSDELEHWIKNNMQEHLKSGRLVYYKTCTPMHFNRSHSRNLAYKLASGDLICNIDADNYTGKGFAAYINEEFKRNDNIFLTTLSSVGARGHKQDVLGRMCVKKSDFYKIGGYDERMVYYGFEDYDFANRLEFNNVSRTFINRDQDYFKAITHSHTERLSNEYVSGNLTALLVNYLSPSSTDFLFLFNNGEYKRGIVIDPKTYAYSEPLTELQKSQIKYPQSTLNASWLLGEWSGNESEITLESKEGLQERLYFNEEKKCFISGSDTEVSNFYKIHNRMFLQQAIMFYSQFTNRIIMHQNKIERRVVVNEPEFGKDLVYKNFDDQTPITS